MGISNWKPEHEEALRKYCALKTLSYRDIANKLAEDFGVSFSRNACLGKANRLGIVSDHRYQPPNVQAIKIRATRKPRVVKTGYASFATRKLESFEWKLRAIEIVPLNLSIIELEANSCRYPYGDGPFTYCGHPQRDASSYCIHHSHLVRLEPRIRRLAA